ncbi:MAG: hypothetical protein IJ728_00700 [Selenomonadaceae bacterium]|nr:hypothetical protein [Selenomonadaceae bacterium]
MLIFEDDTKKITGEFHLAIYKASKLINEYNDHNLVVNDGRRRLAQLAAGLSNSAIKYLGVGSGSDEESPTDFCLQEQVLIPLTTATVNDRDARFDFIVDRQHANNLTIREFGLFCADGTMFSHRVRFKELSDGARKVLQIDKEDDIVINGYWIIHF